MDEPTKKPTGIIRKSESRFLVLFGGVQTKIRNFQKLLTALWASRDQMSYAWSILKHGVCDACSLGSRGLEDDVIEGTHLCMSRLKRLRRDTIGPFSEADVADMKRLRKMNNERLQALGRIPYPFIYRSGMRGFERISWEKACALAGGILRETEPERQAYLAKTNGLTNETYYVFGKTARLMGTNNVALCTLSRHATTISGLSQTIGVTASTVSLSDLIGTDLISLWGADLENNQPVSDKYLHHAKKAGTRIVSINTLLNDRESSENAILLSSNIIDDCVQVNADGDLALMNAILKHLITWGSVDHDFIDSNTVGWSEMVRYLETLDMNHLIEQSGVERTQIEWLAAVISKARTMVTIYSEALAHKEYGIQYVKGIVNLHISKGAIGKPKSGIMPLLKTLGLQGGEDCGFSPSAYLSGFPVNSDNAVQITKLWGHSVSEKSGLSLGPMMEAAHNGDIDILYNMGGAIVAASPQAQRTIEGLKNVRFRIHQGTHLNISALVEPKEAILILPSQTQYEQRGGGTFTSTDRRIRFSPEILGHPKIGECKPEYEIPGLIAAVANPELKQAVSFASTQAIRTEMARVVPLYQRIDELSKEGNHWQWGGPQLCVNGSFVNMPDGKAIFTVFSRPKRSDTDVD